MSRRKVLVTLEFATGAVASVGGVMLIARPDGSLLHADMSVLSGSPFHDWRLPGLLLAGLVGGGFVVAGTWQLHGLPHARILSLFAGFGLIAFEITEVAWIGFQPLEIIFGVVGGAVAVLAVRQGALEHRFSASSRNHLSHRR